MGEDISRSTFIASKRYSAVRQQQGRVNLDADWNEQIDIAAHRLGAQTRDVLGYSGAPRDNAGFALAAPGAAAGFAPNDLTISAGRIYVAGHLCELGGTVVAIENFTGDGSGTAGTQVQLVSTIIDGLPLQPGQWVQISAQGSPTPTPQFAQVTAANAANGTVTFSSSVSSFGPPNTSPQLVRVTTYMTQPDYPAPPPLPTSGSAIVYLDVWERSINFLDDPGIQETALGGPDTTTRTKTVWQVKVLPLPSGTTYSCSTPDSEIASWAALIQPSGAVLSNGVQPSTSPGPCSIATGAGFTGMENQLYRVEIHQPGLPDSSAGAVTYPLAAGTATFKWSRDNASVTTGVTAIASTSSSTGAATNQLTVISTGRDAVLSFSAQDWIEITDDYLELNGQPGELHQIDSNGVDTTRSTITLTSPVSSLLQQRFASTTNYHTRIIRWDQRGQVLEAGSNSLWANLSGPNSSGDIPVPPAGTSLILENGITVSFGLNSTGTMNAGDAWTFAARAATGAIESLIQAPPSAVRHSYCRLGTASFNGTLGTGISDCRQLFAPLADPGVHVTAISLTGSGQNLLNDSNITVLQLGGGISVSVDGPLDPSSVQQPNNTLVGNTQLSTAQATCFVSVGWPMLSGATIFGFQDLALGGTVSLDTGQTTINWVPALGVTSALGTQMTAIAAGMTANGVPGIVPTLLAHLTLKGNSIWSADDPSVFLDGDTLGSPYLDANGVEHTGLLLPSGDGHRGGDFSMWFWLTSPPAPPPLTISAQGLAFVDTPVGVASLPLSVTVANTTAAALPVAIGCMGDFAETNTSTGGIVPENGSFTINVVFTPTQPGSRSGSLNVTTGNTNLTVALSGNGVPFQLQAIPTAVSFGSLLIGTTSDPVTITLTNAGAATTPISITGFGTGSVSYLSSISASTLPAGQSCTISIQFAPKSIGSHPDALTVNTVPAGLLVPIPLSGTGRAPKAGKDIPEKRNPNRQIEQIVRPIGGLPVAELPNEAVTGKSFIQEEERPAIGKQVLEEPK